jgi:hypothetical protein
MKADRQATEAAHFLDPDSFVFKDGREWLRNKDWEARKQELWDRAGGKCEDIVPYSNLRCSQEGIHPHHLRKKSVAHDDRLANLMLICADHHRLMHPEKQLRSGKS